MIAGFSTYRLSRFESDKKSAVVICNNVDWDDRMGHTLLLTLSRNASETAARRRLTLQASRLSK